MDKRIQEQQNNPLHGLKAETMLTELVDFYDWDILYAALGLKCFHLNPTIASSVKFLKKTEWAKDKVENFYLYRFKRMPRASAEQFEMKPRERGFADGVEPKEPMELTHAIIVEMQEQAEANYRAKKAGRRPRY